MLICFQIKIISTSKDIILRQAQLSVDFLSRKIALDFRYCCFPPQGNKSFQDQNHKFQWKPQYPWEITIPKMLGIELSLRRTFRSLSVWVFPLCCEPRNPFQQPTHLRLQQGSIQMHETNQFWRGLSRVGKKHIFMRRFSVAKDFIQAQQESLNRFEIQSSYVRVDFQQMGESQTCK